MKISERWIVENDGGMVIESKGWLVKRDGSVMVGLGLSRDGGVVMEVGGNFASDAILPHLRSLTFVRVNCQEML